MVEIQIAYLGQLRCDAKHGPSGTRLTTDAPVDNKGKGEAFSPTDLVATALGTCMLTTMAIRTMDRSYPLDDSTIAVKKHMTQALPRRIETLEVSIRVPRGEEIDAEGRERLAHAAHHCPVRLSILDAIAVPVTIDWA
jgi:putative redox protein